MVRNWARSKKFPDLASTRFRIHSGLKNIHSGERIQKVPDSPANSPDQCGRKANPERKICGLKNIPILVVGAQIRYERFHSKNIA